MRFELVWIAKWSGRWPRIMHVSGPHVWCGTTSACGQHSSISFFNAPLLLHCKYSWSLFFHPGWRLESFFKSLLVMYSYTFLTGHLQVSNVCRALGIFIWRNSPYPFEDLSLRVNRWNFVEYIFVPEWKVAMAFLPAELIWFRLQTFSLRLTSCLKIYFLEICVDTRLTKKSTSA